MGLKASATVDGSVIMSILRVTGFCCRVSSLIYPLSSVASTLSSVIFALNGFTFLSSTIPTISKQVIFIL